MTGDFYLPGNSIVHRFDARAKLICLLGSVASFFYPLPVFWSAVFLLFWVVVMAASVGFNRVFTTLRTILPILLLVAVLTPLFNRQGSPVLCLGDVVLVSDGGLTEAVRMIVRFSGVTIVFYLYFSTTELTTILLSFQWYGMPFRSALIITIAFRYIPHLSNLYRQVRDAHTLRRPGEILEGRAGPLKKIRSFFPTLTSVLIQAVKSIDPLSMALEVKGVGRRNRRTTYGALKSGNWLVAEFIVAIIIITAEVIPLCI